MDRPTPQPVHLLLLLLVSGLLFFVGLGSMGLTDRDEGRNAEAGREMFASGDLVTPTFNGELRVAKPVFVYWLMTGSYQVFGVNEFAARAPSAHLRRGVDCDALLVSLSPSGSDRRPDGRTHVAVEC